MITSKQNQYVKLIRELRTKKGRNEYKKLVIEGKKTILDCLMLKVKFDYILFDNTAKDFVDKLEVAKFEVSKEILNSISCHITPQGVIAVVEQPKLTSEKPTTNFLVLDGLQDAGNIGTILRTAIATEFNRVILIDCADVFSEKVVNSSMTAVFNLEIQKVNRDEFVSLFKNWNLPLLVADLQGENALHLSSNYGIMGLVIGNEGNGISKELKSIATNIITLPMNEKIESLNAGVSAGVLMYILKYNLKGE